MGEAQSVIRQIQENYNQLLQEVRANQQVLEGLDLYFPECTTGGAAIGTKFSINQQLKKMEDFADLPSLLMIGQHSLYALLAHPRSSTTTTDGNGSVKTLEQATWMREEVDPKNHPGVLEGQAQVVVAMRKKELLIAARLEALMTYLGNLVQVLGQHESREISFFRDERGRVVPGIKYLTSAKNSAKGISGSLASLRTQLSEALHHVFTHHDLFAPSTTTVVQ